MKERPILFNAEMVNAVLSGRKTQTRLVIQSPAKSMQANGMQVIEYREAGDKWHGDHVFSMRGSSGTWHDYTKEQFLAQCPLGAVGDRLWVREAWSTHSCFDDYKSAELGSLLSVHYWADGHLNTGKKRPSIHMPRWASRITLEITGVRVERLQDISHADAIAEGGPQSHPSIDAVSRDYGFPDFSRSWFGQTWWSIYGEESWQLNPWVWVVEFKRVEATS